MANEDVNIKVTAETAAALEGWRKIADGPLALQNALKRLGDEERKVSKGWASSLTGVVGQWASIGSAIALARAELGHYLDMRRRLREEENSATNNIDDLANRFYVQGGISKPDQDRYRKQVLAIGARRKVLPATAFQVGTQLESSGLSPDQVTSGGALDEMLQLLTTTNAAGDESDPRQITKAVVQWLTANGLKPTRENFRSQSVALQRLFAGTNLQLGDLEQFAPAASVIQKFAHTKPQESLAIASQFLDLTNMEMSRTAFKTAVTRLATGGANTEVQRGLDMIGLKPGDVDFQGESFEQAMRTMIKAFDGVDGAKANSAAKLIFGQEALSFYTTLANPGAMDEMRRRVALTADEQGYRDTLAIAESGRGAGRRQAETLAQESLYNEGALDRETVRNRIIAMTSGEDRRRALSVFERPGGAAAHYLFGKIADDYYSTEDRASAVAGALGNDFMTGGVMRRDRGERSRAYFEQLTGKREITVRILTNDGRDVPVQSEGEALNQNISTDATQSSNFRP